MKSTWKPEEFGNRYHYKYLKRRGTAMTEYYDEDPEIVRRLTAAMREADRAFERTGGSTRHHVRDCLLPILNKHGLRIEMVTEEEQ